jgi:hypothetical protein
MAEQGWRIRLGRGVLLGLIAVGSFVAVIVAVEVATDLWSGR